MKKKLMWLFMKLGPCIASAALIVALGNAGRSCWFLAYQPEVPTELQK